MPIPAQGEIGADHKPPAPRAFPAEGRAPHQNLIEIIALGTGP